jgi:hypothetical protein
LGENILGLDPTNPNATIAMLYAVNNPWDFTQAVLYPASYLKMREVSITYAFPARLAKSMKLQNISFSVYSRNIILWTKAKINIDPENAYLPTTGVHGGIQFEQGLERNNITPWSIPMGVKLNVTF